MKTFQFTAKKEVNKITHSSLVHSLSTNADLIISVDDISEILLADSIVLNLRSIVCEGVAVASGCDSKTTSISSSSSASSIVVVFSPSVINASLMAGGRS